MTKTWFVSLCRSSRSGENNLIPGASLCTGTQPDSLSYSLRPDVGSAMFTAANTASCFPN